MKKRKKVASGNKNKYKHAKITPKKKSAKKQSKKKKSTKRAVDGKWLKGVCYNPKGRPKGDSAKDRLLLAISRVEREKRKPLYEHYVKEGYLDNVILKDIIGKLVANKKHVEVSDADNKMSVEQAKSIQDKQRAKVSA